MMNGKSPWSRRAEKRNAALDGIGEEKPLTTGVDYKACGNLKSEGGDSLGEVRDVVYNSCILNALGEGEAAILRIHHEAVAKRGERHGVLGLAPICRGSYGNRNRLRTFSVREDD